MNDFLYKLLFNGNHTFGYLFGLFHVTSESENTVPVLSAMLPIYLITLFWVIACYFIGSINCSLLISKYAFHDDIRKYGSNNAGTTNMNRTYGKKAAVITMLGDMIKGILAVLPARLFLGDNVAYLCGFVCVLGHCFPAYFGFKGGKGVATAAAVILALDPPLFLILVVIFVLLVALSRFVSLGSIMAAFFFPVLLNSMSKLFTGNSPTALMTLSSMAMSILIVCRHWKNIKKLIDGTENKISFKKKGAKGTEAPQEAPAYRSLHHIDDEDESDKSAALEENSSKDDSKHKKT